MSDKKTAILKAVEQLTENYREEELFTPKNGRNLPIRSSVIDVVRALRSVIFPDISVWIPVFGCFRSIMWDTV